MKKALSLVCVLLALLMILPSCQKKADSGEYDHSADFTEEDGEIYKSVPTTRYKDYEFCILNARMGAGTSASLMDAEGIMGDSLNEALVRRNINVEERLGISVSEVVDTPEKVFDMSVAACLSGEGTYDAICNSSDRMATMAVCGYLVTDVYLPGMDLTKPWWNEKAIEGVSVNETRYLFYGDLQLSYYDSHSMVGVNMDMVKDISTLPDPYKLVERGEWTLDRMLEMMTVAASDTDGNNLMTKDDRYGGAVDRRSILSLISGAGAVLSEKDKQGIPTLSCFTDDLLYDVFKKVSDSLYAYNRYVYDPVKNEADGMSSAAMFKSGRTLFHITTVGTLADLRNMEYEFGVLPMPKYTESQSRYISLINAAECSAIGVLPTGRDLRRTSNILENLAAESHRQSGIKSCYVDSVLSFMYVNDEKSRENLELIFSTGTFEQCQVYNWGGICPLLEEIAPKSESFSSRLAAIRMKAVEEVGNTVIELLKFKQK
ncbi:MAG: hypothetical protein IKL24_05315 [Clostridia bacterium]|nr:hypothetical protein [Clostridia bacterium]